MISTCRNEYNSAETGFYYLQSRYYDSTIGRFINADGYASTGQGFLGYNMFAYCNNSPVNALDPSGNRPVWERSYGNGLFEYTDAMTGTPGLRNSGGHETGNSGSTSSSSGTVKLRDVTGEVNRAMAPYAIAARWTARFTSAIPISGDIFRYGKFASLVANEKTWDIKMQPQWESTIGTPFPGEGASIIYHGMLMTPESLGNYTYGYLGAAYHIPSKC